jgi:hypothetical protein
MFPEEFLAELPNCRKGFRRIVGYEFLCGAGEFAPGVAVGPEVAAAIIRPSFALCGLLNAGRSTKPRQRLDHP